MGKIGRLEHFRGLREDAWFSRLFVRLSPEDVRISEWFINENDSLDRAEFEVRLNRFFLDKEKPKRWKEILELLITANIKGGKR